MIVKENNTKSSRSFVDPLRVKQALIGLELEGFDHALLEYFDFFTKQIPTSAAYFMHVLQKFELATAMYNKDLLQLSGRHTIDETFIKQMKKKVNASISQKEEMYIDYDIREGNPLEEILTSAEDLKVDLLIIGQKANKVSHNILAKNLARKTSANALVIPEGSKKKITNILVPIDFSPNSIRALQAAISLHKQLKSSTRITCLNVYTTPSLNHFKFEVGRDQTKKIIESNLRDGFEAFLTSHAGDYKDQIDVALVEKTQPGIARYIIDYAKGNGCDFLCLGAKGHSKVHLLLMGSVAEEVLDINLSIPTMIVK